MQPLLHFLLTIVIVIVIVIVVVFCCSCRSVVILVITDTVVVVAAAINDINHAYYCCYYCVVIVVLLESKASLGWAGSSSQSRAWGRSRVQPWLHWSLLIRDLWADPKSRSTLGLCHLHCRRTSVQNWGFYFCDPPGALGCGYV